MPLSRGSGFTLVEVVVAAAILLCAVTSAAGSTCVAARARDRAAQQSAAAAVIDRECERLSSLAFSDSGGSSAAGVTSLVREVFPHTQASLDSASSYYVRVASGDLRPGSFVVSRALADGTLRSVATFVVSTPAGWRELAPAAVEGFDVQSCGRLPSDTLAVDVSFVPRTRVAGPPCTSRIVVAADPDYAVTEPLRP